MKIFQLIDLIIKLFKLNKRSKVVLLFLVPTFLLGQNQAFWLGKRTTGAPTNLLLDDYPGAAAAYSVRKLDKDYTGFAMEIRRQSDNATQNIGFVGENLDVTSINTFCSGTTCYVQTWYDQSGNGRDAEQATFANQPTIYTGASVVLENGKSGISFDGTNDNFDLPNFPSFVSQSLTNYFVGGSFNYTASANSNTRYYDIFDGSSHIQFLRDATTQRWHQKNDTWQIGLNATQFTTQPAKAQQFLSTNKYLTSSNDLIINASIQNKIASSDVGSAGLIGKIGARSDLVETTLVLGKIQEFIIYYSDHTNTVYNSINSNINTYYSIY